MSLREGEWEKEAERVHNHGAQLDAAAPKTSSNHVRDLHIRPGWGPGTEGHRGQRCHSRGCSARSNHGLLGGLTRSGAAGCHPAREESQRVMEMDGAHGATNPRLQSGG